MLHALLVAAALTPFDQVVAAERAFAAASEAKGHHAAFLDYLAADAIAFQPLPSPGRAAHEGKPRANGTLAWGPAWATVSSAGDLGLSTGPFQFTQHGDPKVPPVTGWYFSIWRRQADGSWKVAVDAGIGCPLSFVVPASVEDPLRARKPAAQPPGPSDAAKARGKVATIERTLEAAAKKGMGAAVAAHADPQMRVHREGKPPAVGLEAAKALLATDTRALACTTERIVAAASGDLAYSYGSCSVADAVSNFRYGYLRVWRRQADGSFKVFVDVTP